MPTTTARLVVVIVASTACTVVERVGRPPSAGEIARINDAIASGRNTAVEAPIGLAGYPVQQPPCAGGGCGTRVGPLRVCADGACETAPLGATPIKDPPSAIASADDRQITFDTKLGGRLTLPTDLVTGVKVSGTHRTRGTLLGLGSGALADVGVGVLVLGFRGLAASGDDGATPSRCASACDAEIALAMLPALIVGALVGNAVGVPQRFVFGDGATSR